MTGTLIDLDAVPAPRTGRRRPRSVRIVLGLSGLLLAFLPGPAPASAPLPPAILAAGFADHSFVQGDRLFVIGPAPGGDAQILRTFRLPDARPAGRITIGLPGGSVGGIAQAGNTLLVTIGTPGDTLAVDAGTGRALWRFSAAVVAVSPDTVLMTTAPTGDDTAVWAIDARRGTVRWRVGQPVAGQITMAGLPSFSGLPTATGRAPAGLPRWLVTTTARGLITTYDGATGARIAAVQATDPIVTYTAGDQFVIGGGSAGLAAYALPGLAVRWRAAVDPRTDWLQPDCVLVLCAFHGPVGVAALDPATGRTLWDSDRWSSLEPLGSSLVGAVGDGGLEGLRLTVLDPATGHARGDFGGWRAILDPDGSIRYAQHPGPTPNSAYFGELDPASRTVRLLGQASDLSGHCDAAAGALICRRVDGSIAVWPIPARGGVS